MKYVVIVGDGMADEPRPELGGVTPLEYARTPHFDFLAARGEMGRCVTVPEGFPAGSDVANLSVMGYDPSRHYTGRSPLEAVSMGVELNDQDVAFRCNLVTLSDEPDYTRKRIVDYSAGEISTVEARELVSFLGERLGNEKFRFFGGISYRHLLVWREGEDKTQLTPPHDISDRVVTDYLPAGAGGTELLALMQESNRLLADHPVNVRRCEQGKNPANSVWFWGQGRRPSLPLFRDKYGVDGAVISAVDLIKGIGLCAGLRVIEVEGATGTITTNFRGKGVAALDALSGGDDFVLVHIEAPDEAGHQGDLETKVKAIEEIDEKVLGEVLRGMQDFPRYRMLVLPDHPTPLSLRTHTADPVPFVVYQNTDGESRPGRTFTERSAVSSPLYFQLGYRLMDYFFSVP